MLMSVLSVAQQRIDLSGKWNFKIDRKDVGKEQSWYKKILWDDSIHLPASMPQQLKGDEVSVSTKWTGSLYDSSYYYNPYLKIYRQENNIKFPFFLTPNKHYVGVAWYEKQITITSINKDKRVTLFLERPHIQTTVWINGKEVGTQYSLTTPHVYDISKFVEKETNTITIRIDNRLHDPYNVGQDSHSVTDQTQGNWNGIVGKMEVITEPSFWFDDLQVYPDIANHQAKVVMKIYSLADTKSKINIAAESFNTTTSDRHQKELTLSLKKGEQELVQYIDMGKNPLLWSEFSPAMYRLKVKITNGQDSNTKETDFGMREFSIKGKYFYINGTKVVLRGTVENCDFPLTGYAPMDEKSWERVFRICKSFGLNHMRFHSYCPPEAAFEAADIVGFYLQPEGPSWPNHGVKLGYGLPIDTYLMDETKRMDQFYGNHPSFCMMACGNEPAGRWVEWVSKFVDYWKSTDSRHVYTGASVGGSWQWQPHNQYHVKAGARGVNWLNTRPESDSDFRDKIDTVSAPYVSHETGQWCVYPDFTEIPKYTGVNKAKNFEIFRDLLKENKMAGLDHDFMMASGKLQALCYKNEIEKILRTPGYAGFQLLAINDYSGQGTALEGVLNVFFEEKGYINAQQFRRFCSETVPLARMPKFVYTNNETLTADIEVAHFGAAPLKNATTTYEIKDKSGKMYQQGVLSNKDIPIGNCYSLGTVQFSLKGITQATKLNLEIKISGCDATNDWDFWVYPERVNIEKKDIYVTDSLDAIALQKLKDGGKVLIIANGKVSYGKDIKQYFQPVFWNTSWFKMRPPHTLGILTNQDHPLYNEFPTEYHSNLQWWELLNKAQVMQFSEFPSDFQPLVQNIDTWFINRKIGMLFEANVLNGRLIMTSMDLTSDPERRIVARQLYKSVIDYMNTDKFRPKDTVTPEMINHLFTRQAPSVNMFTNDSPDELKPVKKLGR
jgi:hypothetical protein